MPLDCNLLYKLLKELYYRFCSTEDRHVFTQIRFRPRQFVTSFLPGLYCILLPSYCHQLWSTLINFYPLKKMMLPPLCFTERMTSSGQSYFPITYSLNSVSSGKSGFFCCCALYMACGQQEFFGSPSTKCTCQSVINSFRLGERQCLAKFRVGSSSLHVLIMG